MLNFDFLEKGLRIVFLPYFVYGFLRKLFLILYSITWLYLRLEVLGNMYIVIVC